MNQERVQNFSFYLLLIVVGTMVLMMFFPYLQLIALGGILAILFYPLQKQINRLLNFSTVSSFITVLLAMLIILIPIYFVSQLVVLQIYKGVASFDKNAIIEHLSGPLKIFINYFYNNGLIIANKVYDVLNGAFNNLSKLASNVIEFVVSLVLVFFSFYYFLKDGNKFRKFMEQILPLSAANESLLVERLENAVKGVVQGSFSIALLHGFVSTLGFLIFGIPQALLWGVFTVLASLVPTVGTLVSLVPAIAYLFFTQQTLPGIGLTLWAWISIQGIDNFISPRLIGKKVNLHPLVALLSILGGISLFGYLGFLLGPIITAILLTLLDIYKSKNIETK